MFDFFRKKKKTEEIEESTIKDNEEIEKEEDFKESKDTIEDESFDNSEESFEESMEDTPEEKKGLFKNLVNGLDKTRESFTKTLDNILHGKAKIDDDLYDELEEIMISADIGVDTTISVIDELREIVENEHIRTADQIREKLVILLKNKLKENNLNNDIILKEDVPNIILVIGVNGVGKTTTIGKLAYQFRQDKKQVTLVAADTFRAAAIEQLTEWANRSNSNIIAHKEGADPAAVIFDGIKSQNSKNTDVLLCDTAGRLHNKKNLMNELEKISKVIKRESPNANLETLLVLDATTGQNAIQQAKEFAKVANISGYILTKLDGTAKGGVVFPLQVELNVPVKYIGIGEQIGDLRPFDSDEFVEAIFA